jgi:arginase family enzyme
MTNHTESAAHYAIQHEHANDLNELKRLREVNAELVAALRDVLPILRAMRFTIGLSHDHSVAIAARAALAKASK